MAVTDSTSTDLSVQKSPSKNCGGENLPGFKDMSESRFELFERVKNLKQDLQDFRGKLQSQVTNYQKEIVDLQSSLNEEVELMKSEIQDIRNSLQKQMDESTNIRSMLSNFSFKERLPPANEEESVPTTKEDESMVPKSPSKDQEYVLSS